MNQMKENEYDHRWWPPVGESGVRDLAGTEFNELI